MSIIIYNAKIFILYSLFNFIELIYITLYFSIDCNINITIVIIAILNLIRRFFILFIKIESQYVWKFFHALFFLYFLLTQIKYIDDTCDFSIHDKKTIFVILTSIIFIFELLGTVNRQKTIYELLYPKQFKIQPIQTLQLMQSIGKESNTIVINTNQDCSICMEQMKFAKILPCTHLFHKSCIDKWTIKNKTCPLCRTSV